MKLLFLSYPIRFGIVCLFLLVASSRSMCATAVIVVDTFVAAADTTTIEGKDVVVNPGVELTVSGVHNVLSLAVGGTVTHLRGETNGVYLRISGALDVQAGGRIDVTAKGCRGANSDGNFSAVGETWSPEGCTTAGGAASAGGSYGGLGNPGAFGGSPNGVYGIESWPVELGSGGGASSGGCGVSGNGGGRIFIEAQSVIINGAVIADGGGPLSCGGNGSGGAILIQATGGTFSGAGILRAAGGSGNQGAEGGGGRIAVVDFSTNAFVGTFGRAGTIFLRTAGEAGRLTVDGTSISVTNGETRTWHSVSCTNISSVIHNQGTIDLSSDEFTVPNLLHLIQDGTIKGANRSNDVIGSFTILSGATVTHSRGLARGLTLNVARTLEVKSGASINVSEKGYRGGRQDNNPWGQYGERGETWSPGGIPAAGAFADGGGSYGTLGGGNANPTYGLAIAPAELGSGGSGSYSPAFGDERRGGNGGGRVSISAGSVTIDGQILADGGNSNIRNSGGGSGGAISIALRGGTFSGTGIIRANGGSGVSPEAGAYPGGGGRIAIVGYGAHTFAGSIGPQGTLWMEPGHVPAIARTGSLVTVCWPTLLDGYQLEAANALPSQMELWTTLTNAPVVVEDNYKVTLEADGSHRFFRLRK